MTSIKKNKFLAFYVPDKPLFLNTDMVLLWLVTFYSLY